MINTGRALRPHPAFILVLTFSLGLSGCSDLFFGAPEAPPLPGERLSVLKLESSLSADPALADMRVRLPQPEVNAEWPQVGGNPSHYMGHVALADNLAPAWSEDVGPSAGPGRRYLNGPLVADGRLYVLNPDLVVTALDVGRGNRLWSVDLTPEDEGGGLFGGGLAIENGVLYATTPYAQLLALDATNGSLLWLAKAPGPIRAAPTVAAGKVFVVTIDNQVVAYSASNGERLWAHAGVSEATGLLGGAAPASNGEIVVVPLSSGELLALGADSGRLLWSENLAGFTRGDQISTIADIRGRPVIVDSQVIAVSHSGLMVAIDLRRGERQWEVPIASSESPWVAGDFIFAVSNNGELLAITRDSGRIRWAVSLPRFENEKDREDPIYWSGPVLAGDRLLLAGSHGEIWSISPYTGEVLSTLNFTAGVRLAPITVYESVFFLSDDGEIIAWSGS